MAAAALLAGLSGCSEPRPASWLPDDGADVAILRQYAGPDCGEPAAMQVVIRTPEQWARVPWINDPVDFTHEMALAMTLGPVYSDQQSIRITRVWRAGRQLRVAVAMPEPPAGAALARGSPFCIAIVPKCELPVAGFSAEPPPIRVQRSGEVQRQAPRPADNRPPPPKPR